MHDPEVLVHVPMGGIATAVEPEVLAIRGLGSCIALAMHDPLLRLAGLAHTVVPRPLDRPLPGPAWASTEAVGRLVGRMEAQGARRARLTARIAGGASLFPKGKGSLDVGEANARAVEGELRRLGIPLLSRQVGGASSRTVLLHPADGRFEVIGRPRAPLPPGRRARLPAAEDGGETARVLLEAAVTPLARMIERAVLVEDPGVFSLPWDGLVDALGGGGSRLYWGLAPLQVETGRGVLVATLPEEHALAGVHRAIARLSDVDTPAWDVVGEVVSVMTSHVATSLAKLLGTRILPEPLATRVGTAEEAVAAVRALASSPPLLVHGRIHAEAAFRGVDLGLLLWVPRPWRRGLFAQAPLV